MTKEEMAAELAEFGKSLPKGLTKEEVTQAIDERMKSIEPQVTKEDYNELKSALETQGATLAKMGKGMSNEQKQTIEDLIVKEIKERYDEIKAIVANKSGSIRIDVSKAVGDITTASGTVPVAAPAINGVQQAPLSNINLRQLNVAQLMTSIPTSMAAYPYTEAVPKDGDYTFVNEGAVKPEIDFKWETRYATPKKIAAWVRLTQESIKDVAGLESVARDFLRKKHDLKKAKALLFATGIGDEPKGATKYGRVFSAGPLANTIANPNFMNVVNACIVDVATTHNYEDEMPYVPNIVMLNSVDFFINIVSAKTVDGVPLYPTASLFNQITIGGVTIIPDESIPVGKIFVADLGKYNITDYVPYEVQIGYVNDDFIKNQFVILAESRFHQFVKKLDEQAFLYDDFATVKSAITKA